MKIKETINALEWQEAKSMKNIPHEYTVRNQEQEQLYIDLYHYIENNYYIGYFFRKKYKYCDIGNYTYWFMSDDINESKIINRSVKKERYGNN